MPSFRCAGLLALALAADAARIDHSKTDLVLDSLVDMQTGVWLTEQCQDYPEGSDFSLGDTVRIHKQGTNSSAKQYVGLVGCQDQSRPGKICLEMGKGCFDASELRHVGTFEFSFKLLSEAAGQIFSAIKDDAMDVWDGIMVNLASFGGAVGDAINQQREDFADMVKDKCDTTKAIETEMHFNKTMVQTKSRLSMLVDSAVSRWGSLRDGIKNVATTTMAGLVKFAKQLQDLLGDIYDKHLKVKVEALKRYLGGIVAAVTNVPDELNPLSGGSGEPSGLSQAIEGFTNGVGELSAAIMEFAKDRYDDLSVALGSLQAGAGRLIAWCSERWSRIKKAVSDMAATAKAKVQEWSNDALEFACNADVKEMARNALDTVKAKFNQAVDAVRSGVSAIKQGLADTADSLAGMVASAALTIKSTSVSMWESETVQGTLAALREEIRVLKELIVEQAGLVQKFIGKFMSYFARFIPQFVKDRLKTAAQQAKELAVKIQEKVKELMRQATNGDTDTLVVDDDIAAEM